VIGGLTVSTLVTLLFVPVVLSLTGARDRTTAQGGERS
jgi:multidrug efflux pump subunit AcrB